MVKITPANADRVYLFVIGADKLFGNLFATVQMVSLCLILLLVSCAPLNRGHQNMVVANIDRVVNIEEYLAAHIGISAFGGQVFCAYEPLNAVQGVDSKVYLWVMCMEFYLQDAVLERGSGLSVPLVFSIEGQDGAAVIVHHLVPRDGTYYGPDVCANFPRSTWDQIMPEVDKDINAYNDRSANLEQVLWLRAQTYYKVESSGG